MGGRRSNCDRLGRSRLAIRAFTFSHTFASRGRRERRGFRYVGLLVVVIGLWGPCESLQSERRRGRKEEEEEEAAEEEEAEMEREEEEEAERRRTRLSGQARGFQDSVPWAL